MRARRGLSTVIGMVFSIIALSTTLVYITYSMNTLDQYNQVVLSKNQVLLNQDQEKFVVASATFVNNKFNITVINTGNLPINFTKLWIINTTASSTDKVYYYSLTNSLVTPGGILKNIGQSVSSCPPFPTCSFMTTPAYHIKLVTSRGNTQEFNVNSVGSAPINIQFLAAPNTIPATGFKTTLLMIVTNNGSSTLTNLTPMTPLLNTTSNPAPTCTLVQNQANPPRYNALQPGGTIIFRWDLSVSGSVNQSYCIWKAQLQNGYPGNVAYATATISKVTLASTNYAENAGLMTENYTSFLWSQGNGWHNGWSMSANKPTAFSIKLTNNNSTGTFYVSKQTSLVFFPPINPQQNTKSTYTYIVNGSDVSGVTPKVSPNYGCVNGDYCIPILPLQTVTIYFAGSSAAAALNSDASTLDSQVAPNTGFLILFGKFAASPSASGVSYAQNIPFLAIMLQ
ncbi:MAG TPA: hypothetical protein VGR54_07670 [Nitrosopumilaceae archaeon]|nr:hypothetical protein [Nitrosopumilaceae archaeon]